MNSKIFDLRDVSRLIVCIVFILLILFLDSFAMNDTVWSDLSPIREQYQKIKTLHVKSQMLIESNKVPVPSDRIQWIDYEQWADNTGKYKTVLTYAEPNGNVTLNIEYAYNGKSFFIFDKLDKSLSYGKNDSNKIPVPENPMLLPLFFLSKYSDECPCPLKLHEAINSERWQNSLSQSKSLDILESGKKAVDVPTSRTKNGARFDFRVNLAPSGLIEKIERVGNSENILTSIVFSEYQNINVSGKVTHWPKTVKLSEYGSKQNEVTSLTAQINLIEIDNVIPDKTFTIDLALAKHVWDNDANMFVK